jgi:acetyltransferase-like isoleucine patch superfamily enzyme
VSAASGAASLPASCVLHPTAKVGAGTTFGEYCVLGANVTLGEGCRVGHHVVIHADTVIGANVRIDDHATLGKTPMRAANSATTKEQELPPLNVGDTCIVGTGVVLYRGAQIDAKVLMADLSTVRENVTVGRGTIVGRGVTIENFCSVGRYCKLESECYLCAYSTLEDRVFVAPGVVTSNDNFVGRTQERFKHFKGVTVKRGGRIGAGSVTLPGVTIHEDGLVAAGSTVTRDVPANTIVVGSPARVWRNVPTEQLLENQGWVDA